MNHTQLKTHYLSFLDKTQISPFDARVDAGGALLMLGLREKTNDIDLTVPPFIYEALVSCHSLVTQKIEGRLSWELAVWDNVIDLHPGETNRGTVVDGVWIALPRDVLEFKTQLNREKDQVDIERLIDYLR